VNLSQNHRFEFPHDVASACRLDPIEDAAVLGPIKAKPFGWPRKPRPALTGPARDGVRPGGRDERMLAARIEPKNGLQFKPLALGQNQAGVDTIMRSLRSSRSIGQRNDVALALAGDGAKSVLEVLETLDTIACLMD
jgi:hypothetical protein